MKVINKVVLDKEEKAALKRLIRACYPYARNLKQGGASLKEMEQMLENYVVFLINQALKKVG